MMRNYKLISFITLLFLLMAIPFSLKIVQEKQEIRRQAEELFQAQKPCSYSVHVSKRPADTPTLTPTLTFAPTIIITPPPHGKKPYCQGLVCPTRLVPGQTYHLTARTSSVDECVSTFRVKNSEESVDDISDHSGILLYWFKHSSETDFNFVITSRGCRDISPEGDCPSNKPYGNNNSDYCYVNFSITVPFDYDGSEVTDFSLKFGNDEGSSSCECEYGIGPTPTLTPTNIPTLTPTNTPTNSPTLTPTNTPTATLTQTPSPILLLKTCDVQVVPPDEIIEGETITINYGGNNNCEENDEVRLWLEKKNGEKIEEMGTSYLGLGNKHYYKLDSCQTRNSNCSKSVNINTLLSGEYLIHCDVVGESNICGNKCSGNPFCQHEGGSTSCPFWVSCSEDDNDEFKVKPEKVWTYIGYFAGEGNFEGYYTREVDDIKKSDNDRFNICVLTDSKAGAREVFCPAGESCTDTNVGDRNMGATATLSGFIDKCKEKYEVTTDYYLLSLSDHGRGDLGMVGDKGAGGMSLETSKLKEAVRGVDVVFYDACLMGMIEQGMAISGGASYWVVSEETSFTFDKACLFGGIMESLGNLPDPSSLAIAITNISADLRSNKYYTQSAIDLSKMGNVFNTVTSLATQLIAGLDQKGNSFYQCLAEAREKTQKFDLKYSGHHDSEDNSLDLSDLAGKIISHCGSVYPPVVSPAEGVKTAVREAVIAEEHEGENLGGAHGLAIFFPKNGNWNKSKSIIPFLASGWLDFIDRYDPLSQSNVAGLTTDLSNPLVAPLDSETNLAVDKCTGSPLYNLDCNAPDTTDESDLKLLLSYWSPKGAVSLDKFNDYPRISRTPDINQDGLVDKQDLVLLLDNWTDSQSYNTDTLSVYIYPLQQANFANFKKLLKIIVSPDKQNTLSLLDRLLLDYSQDQNLNFSDLFSWLKIAI